MAGWEWGALALAAVALLAALGYWLLVIAEGVYVGPWLVARLYDWVAPRYDRIKQYHPNDEDWYLGRPLARALVGVDDPLILDVATGTGRLPATLLRCRFQGQIVGLDHSHRMLAQAVRNLDGYRDQVTWVWQNAAHLPFDDGVFDAVTCMEALEFLPDPRDSLVEMVRVLTPGGVLFLTNRVGWEARLMPGRTFGHRALRTVLEGLSLQQVQIQPWQTNYELVMARKAGLPRVRGGSRRRQDALAQIRCPTCGSPLTDRGHGTVCALCGGLYPVQAGVLCLAQPRQGDS
jgi:ubiquinone/menaquinone biosynthesis C-methylase UbiE